jgi:RNA polymerase II-associated factor 1
MVMRAVSSVLFLACAMLTFLSAAIQAPLNTPVPHPHDRALLRPLSTLGKPKFSDSGVSFLRRTEYISSYTSKSRFDSTTSRTLVGSTGSKLRRPATNTDRESPAYIKSQIEKSFQTAASNLNQGNLARHPTNRNLKLQASYPLIPDLDCFTDAGGFITIKFLTNPVPPSSTYDIRLDSSILRPVPPTEEEQEAKDKAREAHEQDPERNPPPDDTLEYEFYLADSTESALNFKRKFDTLDPEKDDEELYTTKDKTDGTGRFRFKRIRAYESASQTGSVLDKYDEEVLIAIHDGSDGLRQKAAYYYPILQRTAIRPQRAKNINKIKFGVTNEEEGKSTDYVDMRVEEPDEDTQAGRKLFREHPYGQQDEPQVEEDGNANADGTDKDSRTPDGNDD